MTNPHRLASVAKRYGEIMRSLIVAAGMAVLAAPALAADLPNQKSAPIFAALPAYSWTGFYGGLNAGGGWQNDGGPSICYAGSGVIGGPGCHLFPNVNVNAGGFIGGGQIGYDWQYEQFVFGGETDFQGSTIHGSTSDTSLVPGVGVGTVLGTISVSQRLDWLGTARGRAGYAIGPTLFYVTGGLAYGQEQLATTSLFTASGTSYPASERVTRAGWTVGGGVEYAFGRGWSAKLEGLYYNLVNVTVLGGEVPNTSPLAAHGRGFDPIGGAIVRLGLNYKFDWAPALAAKY
jgi:outer membrane immunogenic protein